jgi:glycine/D-amino acid oxidase-like deaminating enzyme/nitrite reductase/ring-hydroxylating ferredoxin subunit
MDTTSVWTKNVSLPRFAKLHDNCEVDVAIIGAGITGITAAYLLKKAGCKVALIERGRCGGFDTSNTTAHLTCVTDARLHKLASRFGEDTARLVWDSGRAAIDQIFNIIREEKIRCDFAWVPAYLYAAEPKSQSDKNELQKDAALANKFGFPSEITETVPLVKRYGVKFLHQAKFNPLKYLKALLRVIPGRGSYVFENTEAEEVNDKPMAIKAGGHSIRCSYVVLATHTPLMGKTNLASATLFQSKLFLYTSYAVGAKIPRGFAEEASYWDTGEPYDYLRIDRGRTTDYAILGGEDHKTGQIKNTEAPYWNLERRLKRLIPAAEIDSRWSGQVIATPDGMPYIGETAEKQFAATGFAGNGMTFGTLAAMMAADAYRKRQNPWRKLFDVHRTHLSDAWRYAQENKDYPFYMLRDWLRSAEGKSLQSLRRKEGKILRLNGKKVAAFRDEHGKVTLCSPVCTHLKCIVEWNNVEKTWDCPCHGSRFGSTGNVLSGPAEEPLEKIDLDVE